MYSSSAGGGGAVGFQVSLLQTPSSALASAAAPPSKRARGRTAKDVKGTGPLRPPFTGPMPVRVVPLPPPSPQAPPLQAAPVPPLQQDQGTAQAPAPVPLTVCGAPVPVENVVNSWHELLAFNCASGGVHEAAPVSMQVAAVKAAPQEDTHSAAEPSPVETLPGQGPAAFGAQRFGLHTCGADTALCDTGGAAQQLQQPGDGGGTGVSSAAAARGGGGGDREMPPPSPVRRGRSRSRQLSRAESEMSQNTADFAAADVLTALLQREGDPDGVHLP